MLTPDGHALERPLEPIAAALEPTRTVVYKTVGDRSLELRIFDPPGFKQTDKRPVYLTIHGGGWTGRTPRYFYPFAQHFAELGMVAISMEYRLSSEAHGTTVFDCVKDGRSAVRYLRTHADALGIDPDKIVVTGGSAGGHIAAGTAEANIRETLIACEKYAEYGARAVAVISPVFYRLGQESIYAYFKELAEQSVIDVTVYNIPMLSTAIELETIARLSEFERIIGIKDSSGDVGFMTRLISRIRPQRPAFTFMTGWEAVLVPMLAAGADGGSAPKRFLRIESILSPE